MIWNRRNVCDLAMAYVSSTPLLIVRRKQSHRLLLLMAQRRLHACSILIRHRFYTKKLSFNIFYDYKWKMGKRLCIIKIDEGYQYRGTWRECSGGFSWLGHEHKWNCCRSACGDQMRRDQHGSRVNVRHRYEHEPNRRSYTYQSIHEYVRDWGRSRYNPLYLFIFLFWENIWNNFNIFQYVMSQWTQALWKMYVMPKSFPCKLTLIKLLLVSMAMYVLYYSSTIFMFRERGSGTAKWNYGIDQSGVIATTGSWAQSVCTAESW